MKTYEILSSLPPYGPLYIPVTEDGEPFYSEGFVIRFFKSDGTNWVANFKPGWTELNRVFDFQDHKILIVIAGGLGYIMTTENEKPLTTFGLTISEIIQAENGSLVCADGVSVHYLDNVTGDIWESEPISWDGIREIKLVGDLLIGETYDPTNSVKEWSEFSINLKTKEIIGGSYIESSKRNPNILKGHLHIETQTNKWWG
jgi:hypothetical protein